MEFTFDNKQYTGKFNFASLFKANSKFSNIDKDGNSMNNGAANMFVRLINEDDGALKDIFSLWLPAKTSDEKIYGLIDELTNDGETAKELVDEVSDEMKQSGFFKRAIQAYIKQMEQGLELLKAKTESDEALEQIPVLELQLKSLKDAI